MKSKSSGVYPIVVERLLSLSRSGKNTLVMLSDYLVLMFSFWASLSIRLNDVYVPNVEATLLIIIAPIIAIPIFYFFGLYQSFIRYANYRSLLTLMFAVSIYTFLWFLVVVISGVIDKPYDFLIINWLTTIFFISSIRYLARYLLSLKTSSSINVLIYGAGSAGLQLESAMKHNPEMNVIAFIDDDKALQGKYIKNLKVYNNGSLDKLIDKREIDEILIAMPSLSRNEKTALLQSLKPYPVIIRALPTLSDIATGRVSISDLKQVRIEDLLQREIRKPNKTLLKKDIRKKNVLVTGAGGSIGSELCRQIIKQNPNLLILFEISEASLYLIERELLELNSGIDLIAVIGNVTRKSRLDNILQTNKVDTIYHAAAYKHVPMVEKNPIAGIRCNIFGTLACVQSAIDNNVGSFVFISTDKAVRPTNIMGATKRFAELILKAYAEIAKTENKKIRISMVRFGNVLGSSGSVVPLFRRQIEKGGPITVTDPDIIRYFMTISEASQLVIQAGSMGIEGEIFLLDMGKQVQVLDLAKDMISLSGMTIKDKNNLNGDIEIIFTGLRPGEKLYEELLIDQEALPTEHEKIMKTKEKGLEWDALEKHILELDEAVINFDIEKIREIFLKTVSGYSPYS
jgi:UDP-N-acetylglucosamine 4,6-dehydratase